MQAHPAKTSRHVSHDTRADDRSRSVTFAPEAILIERQLAGVRMRVRVPTSAYGDLTIARSLAAAPAFAIVLRHRDPDLCIVVDADGDFAALAGKLPGWARFFGKPIGPLPARTGRRRARRSARRPWFLTRRKCGRPAQSPRVFRNEDEIVCYE